MVRSPESRQRARGVAALISSLAITALPGAASSAEPTQISDDDRRDAGCIDTYNDPKHKDPDELNFRRNSALVRLKAEGVGGATSDGAALSDLGFGARLDIDSPILALLSSAGTDTGLAAGLSGAASFAPNHSRTFTGELRLGIARRNYAVAWSSASARCMRQRVDIGIDLLRWRAGSFTDLVIRTHPTTFVSSVGFPGLVYRRMYPRWGIAASFTVAEFRLAPSFEWGLNGGFEFLYGPVVLGVTLGAYFLPDPAFLASVGVGIAFELGGKP